MTTLNFKLITPTACEFLTFFQMANQRSRDQNNSLEALPQYVLELSLGCLELTGKKPSCLAAASVLLSNMLLQQNPAWPTAMVCYTGYESEALDTCVQTLRKLME